MIKPIGKITWIIALIGVFIIILTTTIINNYILFYVGIGLLIFGYIGVLFTRTKTKEVLIKLLDFI